jgi:hypothetical protein
MGNFFLTFDPPSVYLNHKKDKQNSYWYFMDHGLLGISSRLLVNLEKQFLGQNFWLLQAIHKTTFTSTHPLLFGRPMIFNLNFWTSVWSLLKFTFFHISPYFIF